VMPPVYGVVLKMLQSIKFDLKNKKAGLLVNSKVFGQGLKKVLECRGAEAKIIFYQKGDLSDLKDVDLLVSAVGKPGIIKKEMIKKNAVIIDIGISKKGKKVLGDVDFKSVKDKAGYISPVPGGVGPVTIAMLFKNTLELYKRRKK